MAGHATHTVVGDLLLDGLLAAPDGSVLVRRSSLAGPHGLEPVALGREVATMVLDSGGRDLLEARADER